MYVVYVISYFMYLDPEQYEKYEKNGPFSLGFVTLPATSPSAEYWTNQLLRKPSICWSTRLNLYVGIGIDDMNDNNLTHPTIVASNQFTQTVHNCVLGKRNTTKSNFDLTSIISAADKLIAAEQPFNAVYPTRDHSRSAWYTSRFQRISDIPRPNDHKGINDD